jgi:hypothetical protein
MDIVKQHYRRQDMMYLPKNPLADELKLRGRNIPLKLSASDSPYLQIERARIALEEEYGHHMKEYYDAVLSHIQYAFALPSSISLDAVHAMARLISSENVHYNRP